MEEKMLKGIAASPGLAKGKVKVISSNEDLNNFEDGSILVTHLTDPTMVMVMSRSAAIVTDIGGMMSHPSIVSREMGIPCVVGTQQATSILKDGMEVEVDGTNGIVKIV